jgi:hypothetical protein
VVLYPLLTTAAPWKHLLLFAGLRSAISEGTEVKRKTVNALDHAYIRAFTSAIADETPRDIAEGVRSVILS